ncbi:hypothetical protein ACWDWO_07805 [Actinopolymorpha singaporensis]
MRIQVVTINHGTTDYADLFLRSLIAHHPDRSELRVLVLDNDSGDVQRLDWARRFGVRIRASGYSLDASVNTHGEILRDAVLAEPDCDAYLFADSDVCFVSDDTLGATARELDSTPDAFAVEALWANEDDTIFHHRAGAPPGTSRIRESVRFAGGDWGEPYEFDVDYGDRVHPFCVLVRNDPPFRSTVELLGLSPAMTQCVRGAMFWDTFGLLTQVMRTHGRSWALSSRRVVHFAGVSWQSEYAEDKAARRDTLLGRYPLDHLRSGG